MVIVSSTSFCIQEVWDQIENIAFDSLCLLVFNLNMNTFLDHIHTCTLSDCAFQCEWRSSHSFWLVSSRASFFILQISCLGAAETFRGLGMASLVTLLIFSLIQLLFGQNEDKSMFILLFYNKEVTCDSLLITYLCSFTEGSMLAENIPVPSSPVPIATIDLVHNQSASQPNPESKTLLKKTRYQEEQEDAKKPAWVVSASPWVTIAFALHQIRDMVALSKNDPCGESQAPQVGWPPLWFGMWMWGGGESFTLAI